MNLFHIDGQRAYEIDTIESIDTPALLVFEDRVKRNLEQMKTHLNRIDPGSDFKHLCAHIKTNKSPWTLRLMQQAGIEYFKTTLNELELAVDSGMKDIFLAYPLLSRPAKTVAGIILDNPDVHISVQAGSDRHLEILEKEAERSGVIWSVFLDVDVGMHRTGADTGSALKLMDRIHSKSCFQFEGIHAYDGHIHHKQLQERKKQAEISMNSAVSFAKNVLQKGIPIPRIVAAGSITYLLDLDLLLKHLPAEIQIQVSPGTFIYWDTGYDEILPGDFEFSALVLSQLIEAGSDSVTLNLGHKRWGADNGPVELFSVKDARVKSFSEEHTVLHAENHNLKIGDYICVVPRHVCPTVNLYETFTVVGEGGKILENKSPVQGRNR
ncbi:hypothetical protein BVY01_00465 [bacterium I07]|nr:hypothetical protein BVY01_00465 [bacterium I07]